MSGFTDIYKKVVQYTRQQAINPEGIDGEYETIAEFCSFEVPQKALLDIADDREFVINAFYKVLNRAPRGKEVQRRVSTIKSKRDRIRIINDLMRSDEYAEKGVRVRFSK